MHSLVEESIHELFLLGLHVLQVFDVLTLSLDAILGFVKLFLRSRSVLVVVHLVLVHVHTSHVGILVNEPALELFK
jgi:hypothetical protein